MSRRRLGIFIMGLSILIGLLLWLSGVQFFTVLRSDEINSGATNTVPAQTFAHAEIIRMHWPMKILPLSLLLGLVLTVIPSRKNTPPKIQS
ncbi:MAG TPA: hypothetical protein VH413_05870 [Verrucomicrobiae bacterium]|nr:hypothetical protein [Verrucomicrobiae bacterium]